MQDLLTQLSNLRRPRLLIRAARIAVPDYRRATRLPRLLGYGMTQKSGPALMRLMCLEAEMNDKRENGDASYSIADHVELLTAVMGESHLMRAQMTPPQLRSVT
ncbi:DUF6477 family protein [Marivita sp. S0852]|uniref:DUF6477 family protein n=1 Tax=Marivita sp. S0852 TaxID=3373893 RepID=UPI003981F0CC